MKSNEEREMSLIGHLTELRTRLIISLSSVAVGVILALLFAKPVLTFLTLPIKDLIKEPGRTEVLTLIVGPDDILRLKDAQAARAKLKDLSHGRFRLIWPADPANNLPEASFEIGDSKQSFVYSHPLDPVTMQLKVAIVLGLLLALPILLWQIWLFILPGLTAKEKRIVKPLLSGAVFLFPLGAAFAYYMIKFVLRLMRLYEIETVEPMLNIFSYLSLLC